LGEIGYNIWIFGGLLLLVGGRFAWWLLLALGEMGQALFRGNFGYTLPISSGSSSWW
jgi:hypothetical protein